MLRHLPPTATPLSFSDYCQGLRPPAVAPVRFQAALAHYLNAYSCELASSGRTALYLLLRQLATEYPARQEVVLPAYTCPALVKVTLDVGLWPCLVDISPCTLDFEPEQLASRIHEGTLAVICVHPFGIPQPIKTVRTLAHTAGAVLIEDAAQAMGARIGERPAGSQGDFGLFSLGPGKPLSTGGGGILCANNEKSARLLGAAWRALEPAPVAASAWAMLRLALLMVAFHPSGWWLATRAGLHRIGDHEASWGYALRGLTAAQAAIGLALLPRLDAINERRGHNARRLAARPQTFDFVHVPSIARTAKPIYLRLPLIVDSEERRERLFRRLWAAGIGAGRMYRQSLPELFPQLTMQTYPGATAVARRLLTLPTHHYVINDDMTRINAIFDLERVR
ncbi:MAG TPA: DegT/DnrJ/EryC1/StrS family aminotransferase [Anaerolineae bacterium]